MRAEPRFAASLVALLVACSGSHELADGGPLDASRRDAATFDAAPPVDGGPSDDGGPVDDAAVGFDAGPCVPLDCDDGVACTVDECGAEGCSHAADDDLCPVGARCDAALGCVVSACAESEDCAIPTEPCADAAFCRPDGLCEYPIPDRDGDGFGDAACGGDDCDDDDPTVHPGAEEECNGVDQDCDGLEDFPIDEEAACGEGWFCWDGECLCPLEREVCGTECVALPSDDHHCGECDNRCVGGRVCDGGECVCPPELELCSGTCADTETHRFHCGGCGSACLINQDCIGGECFCPVGSDPCRNRCQFLDRDPNHCGACDARCLTGALCESSVCRPSYLWSRGYAGPDGSLAEEGGVAVGPDGVSYAVGMFYRTFREREIDVPEGGDGDVVLPWASDRHGFLLRHASDGELTGARTLVSSSRLYPMSVAPVDGDGVIVAGRFRGTLALDGNTYPSAGSDDGFITRFDADLAEEWTHTFGGGSVDFVYDIAIAPGGEIVAVGDASGTVDFGGGPLAPQGTRRGFVLVLASDGGHLASWRIPAHLRGVAIDASGRIVVGGDIYADTDLGSGILPVSGITDVFVARYTFDGTLVSAHSHVHPRTNQLGALTVLGDDVYIAARRWIAARILPDGTMDWAREVAFADMVLTPSSIVVDGDGVFVAGSLSRTVDFGDGVTTWGPGFVAAYAPSDGALDWVMSFRATGTDSVGPLPGVAIAPDGELHIAGSHASDLRLGNSVHYIRNVGVREAGIFALRVQR